MPPVSKPNMRVPTAMRPDWMGRSLWAFGLLLVALGLFFLVDPFGNNAGSANVVTAPTPVSAQSPDAGLSTQPIETICVGQRVAGKNPTGAFDDSLGDVNPATWRHLKLRMTKSDGGRLELELLRPTWWVEAHDARTGGTIGLDLPELGAQGVAEVFSIGDCPELSPGEGHVVTGTFAHSSTDVVDLSVVGLTEPIGVTANHPIWSVDREQFVEAGKFHPGERMRSFSGDTVRVISLLPRPGPQLVYNLEVHGEHVYYVSSLGLMAHNTCTPRRLSPEMEALSEANITDNGITVLGRFQSPPRKMNYIQKATTGKYKGSSYFDLGDAWTPVEGKGANQHFLDIVGGRGDKIIFSTPKKKIPTGGSLDMEVQYLKEHFGYAWVNQWSMRKR